MSRPLDLTGLTLALLRRLLYLWVKPAVLPERPEIVLLDNMTLDQLRSAVALREQTAPEVELEASGGVRLDTVRHIAETGVDRVSVGGLTHSAQVLDVGMDENPA